MPDVQPPEVISVLNGEVRVGDQVAIGVRDGTSGGIRLGTVVAIKRVMDWNDRLVGKWNPKTREYDIPAFSVQVKVTKSSEYTNPEALANSKPRWYGTDNMVKIS